MEDVGILWIGDEEAALTNLLLTYNKNTIVRCNDSRNRVFCAQSSVRRSRILLLLNLLPATRAAGEIAADYFELMFKMMEPEDSRLYLTVRGFLHTTCALITDEMSRIETQERSSHTDISQCYILQKLIKLLSKFLTIAQYPSKFMKEELLAQILEALLAIRGLVVQKTKLIAECGRLL